jgi:hypothetical protein
MFDIIPKIYYEVLACQSELPGLVTLNMASFS